MADARRLAWPAAALLLCLLALARPVDHDESQYVAAAVLTARGLLPFRDFAYLQTPLQPFLFAPIAWTSGAWTWPALRLVNTLLGAAALGCTFRAARLLAPVRVAAAATALFACCDVFLFSVGTARNDALPAACLAGALWLVMRAENGRGGRVQALATGLLFAAAAAAKVSYAIPAAAYGLWALTHRAHRPLLVALGALPVLLFVGWTWWLSPGGFLFGVFTFPATAPGDWYAERPWKLSAAAKALDTLKFLALGPALLAIVIVARRPWSPMLAVLALAGLIAAILPTPTWRQYQLPLLPPLFVLLAARWTAHPPGRAQRVAAIVFACAGLAPTVAALASGGPAMITAMRQGQAIRVAMDRSGVTGPVATLSPQFLPATGRPLDPRFAPGPFWFRTRTFAAPPGLPLLALRDLRATPLPRTILTGGEAKWTSGDDRLDGLLEREARRRGYTSVAVTSTPFRLYLR